MKLRKFICCNCGYINPLMELLNTNNCLECGYSVSLIQNGYVVINPDNFSVIEISNSEDEFIFFSESDILLIHDFESFQVSKLYGYRLKDDLNLLNGDNLKEFALKELDKLFISFFDKNK